MNLFLTSITSRTLPLLLPYLDKNPKDMRVAFIPTASDVYEVKPWVDDDRNKLLELGFNVVDVDLKGRVSEELEAELDNMDALFVTGGSTSYLLEQAQISGFIDIAKKLVGEGILYI